MGKLNLVIADRDENYLEHLGNYLMVCYSGKFTIYQFSAVKNLQLFLKSAGKRLEILLCSHSFLKEGPWQESFHTIIQLSENDSANSVDGVNAIFKYRHAESLVQDILHIYSKNNLETSVPAGKKITVLCAVHSAAGGAGTTCIAAGLSMLAARRGLKPFYLNLESTPSTSFYFKGRSERTLSDVIYYIKEKGSNLVSKLEGGYCSDASSGVHYFLPPDSASEFEELTEEDMVLLLGAIRSWSLFDIVFIDLPSGLSRRNKSVFKCCDKIIDICEHGASSLFKKGMMEGDPETGGDGKNDILHCTLPILNKYSENTPCDWYERSYTDKFTVIIHESERVKYHQGEKLLIDADPVFSSALGKLLNLLAASGSDEKSRPDGGAAIA